MIREMFTEIQYRILKAISSGEPNVCDGSAYIGKSKLRVLLGDDLLRRIQGQCVIDFGCGEGDQTVEMALHGARRVIGVEIQETRLKTAAARAESAGVSHLCHFATHAEDPADVVISIDAFEHFDDPGGVLEAMYGLLRPGGEALISFGCTWYHPHGGHLFSVFPWAHLIFSERALIRWRADFKSDGATRFHEVAGGLNQMTIRRFQRLVEASPFRLIELKTVPIRRLRRVHNRWTREFTTSVIRCRLARD